MTVYVYVRVFVLILQQDGVAVECEYFPINWLYSINQLPERSSVWLYEWMNRFVVGVVVKCVCKNWMKINKTK